ncbi:MAG: glycosyltransferase [bacterium]|nr:glycosyltransferase [bacterium]
MAAKHPPRVCVCIPHHRGKHHLKPLFTSLTRMETGGADVRIAVADNASSDGSAAFAQRRFPEVEWLSFGENLGFAPALNRLARTCEADWLIFLNNDIRVESDWLVRLLEAADLTGGRCLCSRLLSWDGRDTQFAGGWINLFGKGFEDGNVVSDDPYEIFFGCGCGLMIERNLFLESGGFDDAYFMIYEDVDLGWRLRLLGHPVWMVPAAKAYHRGHASLALESFERKAVYLERNSLATIYKNYDKTTWARLMPLALRDAQLRARALASHESTRARTPDGTATLRGVRAFMENLDYWRERREWIQSRRVIGDSELFERFFPHPEQRWAYAEEQYRRLGASSQVQKMNSVWARALEWMR